MRKIIQRLCVGAAVLGTVAAMPSFAATSSSLPMGTKSCSYTLGSLGKCLTAWGAIRAGNAAGTIPAYTGGLKTPPPGASVKSGRYPTPFPNEKPILRIDAKNMAKYKDHLSAGVQYLMKKYPGFYINVYPSHRTAAFPKYIVKGMLYNARHAKMDGIEHVVGAKPGFPFPIVKSGAEAQWNSNLRYRWPWMHVRYRSYLIDSNGNKILISGAKAYYYSAYNDPAWKGDPKISYELLINLIEPARQAGIAVLQKGLTDYRKKNELTWLYNPGQRRVRLAPEISYDTPDAAFGGALFGDETDTFSGSLSRYKWKVLGRKEMYIPYNDYKLLGTRHSIDQEALKHYVNPKYMRWELHRVWVLQATLAPGKRHVEVRKVFYIDEDTWTESLWDAWDASGRLYRMMMKPTAQSYFPSRLNHYWSGEYVWDFSKNTYVIASFFGCKGCGQIMLKGPFPKYWFTPSYLKSSSYQ